MRRSVLLGAWGPSLLLPLLLLDLLLKLLGPGLVRVVEDALVQFVAGVRPWLVPLVVHDNVTVLVSDHLHLRVRRLLILHHHPCWVLPSSILVELLPKGVLLLLLTLVARHVSVPGLIGAHDLTLGCSLLLSLLLLELLLALDGGPVDSIADRLATSAKYWEGVEPDVLSEDLLPVLLSADVVLTLEGSALLVEVLDSGLVLGGEHQVEFQECSHESSNHDVHQEGENDHDVRRQLGVVGCQELSLETP